ncbi:aminopeptidase N-like, partial [Physella acuta]|uniref:aminopeptidase N-like n=1 Tax=Physella acuta TaxID=109671 RepID=UPI0027DE9071
VEGETTYVKDVYEMTPLVSSYLLAFVISDFDHKYTYTTNGTLFRTWARKEAIDQVDYSLEIGANLTTYFEDLFNVHYPLPKQDMIAVPDFVSGAMENWGLITYRETSMLHKEGVSNEANRQRVATIVSHEIAHQWFGNLVTPSWWDDLWLNEGFASFGEYLGVDYAHPDWHIFDVMVVSELHTALSYDGLVSSHPVYVPVSHPDEINEIFDTISYSKGSSIIRMMYHFLGHDTFKKGMHRYLKAKEYDAAFHDDLWNALTEQTLADGKALNVKEIMDTWTLQMNYPLVTVTVVSPNKIKVSQKRFLEDYNATDPEIYESPFGYRWNIPITLTTNDNDKFSQEIFWLWKNETSKEITLPQANLDVQNGWVLANLDTKGFYRVNYAEKNWEALCKQLLDQHERIPVINRAQIINDAWSLAKSGDIALSTAFKTIDYLHKEKAYAPWYTARRELNYMSSMLSVNSLNGPFQKFMQAKINSSYSYFGFNNSGSSHSEILARSLVVGLACSYGIQSCVDTALSQFKQWMDNPKSNPIDPNFKSTVYCNAISAGGWEEWQFGLRMYTETDMATERSSLLSAMACSRQPWILNHYMGLILEKGSPIRKQDGLTVIIQVASNSVGRPLAWNFFRFHYAEIKEEYSNSVFQWMSIFGSLTRSYNTEFELNELKAFKASNVNNLGTGARNLDQAIETVATNIKWMQVNQKSIQSWLSNATLSTE